MAEFLPTVKIKIVTIHHLDIYIYIFIYYISLSLVEHEVVGKLLFVEEHR